MLRFGFLLLGIFLCTAQGVGQSLIVNGDFEVKLYCPSSYNQNELKYIDNWQQPTRATPDYFHRCSNKAGVPQNIFGRQEAQSGDGYVGLVTFTPSTRGYREYLQTKLARPLVKDEWVCVSLFVSPSDLAAYVTDGLGCYFSATKVRSAEQTLLNAQAQISNPRLHLFDQYDGWVKISDVFQAIGGEQYLTIGNFMGDRETRILRRNDVDQKKGNQWAYLYIDNISVEAVSGPEACSCLNPLIAEAVHDPPLQLGEVNDIDHYSIHFAFDSYALEGKAQKQLMKVSRLLSANAAYFIEIDGHTDSVGSETYNLGLSKSRAEAVISFLQENGIAESRLKMRYYGSQVPAESNQTDEGRAQNRRVEFKLSQYRYDPVSVD